MLDRLSLVTGLLLVALGVRELLLGSPGPTVLFLVLGTGLAGSANLVPAWGKVGLFLALLLTTLLLLVPVL
jgi:hypothetical protein